MATLITGIAPGFPINSGDIGNFIRISGYEEIQSLKMFRDGLYTSGNIIPGFDSSGSGLYDLGSPTIYWDNVYANSMHVSPGGSSDFVLKAGDTMTGDLIINGANLMQGTASAVGINNVAFNNGVASGIWSAAFGSSSTANGNLSTSSMAAGTSCYTEGPNSFAFGTSCETYESSSFAFGESAIASGDNSFAFGNRAYTKHNGAMVLCDDVGASDVYSSQSHELYIKFANNIRLDDSTDINLTSSGVNNIGEPSLPLVSVYQEISRHRGIQTRYETTNYSIAQLDKVTVMSGIGLTALLPSSAIDGQDHFVKNISTATLIISGANGELIDGRGSWTVPQYDTMRLVSIQGEWFII